MISFIIHSPSVLSQKYWITNSAVDAQWCVVFAQTIVGGSNHGIHGFLVRVRNEDHSVAKGVRLEDVSAGPQRQRVERIGRSKLAGRGLRSTNRTDSVGSG